MYYESYVLLKANDLPENYHFPGAATDEAIAALPNAGTPNAQRAQVNVARRGLRCDILL